MSISIVLPAVILACMAQPGADVPEHAHTNKLVNETSPYLLQHAHNPVDWHPWGEEAFAEARRRHVPIFLSIGYSTCYWCHVMEREVFENEDIAAIMNERFVNIKVDREERPDIDDIYMMATVLQNEGQGGWPMSVFLEPAQLRPFFTGTYFPPEPAFGRMSFPQVIEGIHNAWTTQPDTVEEVASSLAEAVRERLAIEDEPVPVGEQQVADAAGALLSAMDRTNGGLGGAPKFPQPSYLRFLLDVRRGAAGEATADALDQVIRLTLDKMATGGVYDQVGGGFHRYSVDTTWTVPHFEKMLYDNAQLMTVYADASELYDDPYYAEVVRETADYLLREMLDDAGGFHSAQDAEVDHREGLNYLWTPEQVTAALDEQDAAFLMEVYGLNASPNFQDPHHPEDAPKHVLRLSERPDVIARSIGMPLDAFNARLAGANEAMLEVRDRRKQPGTDDKVLTSWNGLTIAGLSRAGALLEDRSYVDAAQRAADFMLDQMLDDDVTLRRSYRDGQVGSAGFLEDYAALVTGLIELHRARASLGMDEDPTYLSVAETLVAGARARFGRLDGGFYDTRPDQSDLFVRTRSTSDNAVPSGVSMMLHGLLDLHELTGNRDYLDEALATLQSVSSVIAFNPTNPVNSTRGLLRLLRVDELAGHEALDDEAAEPRVSNEFTPVVILADTDRISVGEGQPATFTIKIQIAEPYHILAADGGDGAEGLTPLRVHVVGGTGINAYADYPAGTPYAPAAAYADELLVHSGEVEIEIAVERSDQDWTGTPLIAVTFQACDDTSCLMARTLELDVAIDH